MADDRDINVRITETCSDVKAGDVVVMCECGKSRPVNVPHAYVGPAQKEAERVVAGTVDGFVGESVRVVTPGERDRRAIAGLIEAIEKSQRDIAKVVAGMRITEETAALRAERIVALCDVVTDLGCAITEARHG